MMKFKKTIALALTSFMLFTGCVDQRLSKQSQNTDNSNATVAATSVSIMQICEKLDLNVTGIPKTSLAEIPENYENATIIGSPMNPDMEILSQLSPDWVLSPSSLSSDLAPKYDAAGFQYGFVNLKSIFGMYKSIDDMGKLFNREEEAKKLTDEFNTYYESYKQSHLNKQAPTVLILMGLPGSYVVATENSYVGSLVEMAGGINIYAGSDDEFLNVNTEDMLKKDPDIILRTAHALPDSVMEMFAEEFKTNDIWKHFTAVKNNKVYDLPHGKFGMSANFEYAEALETLDQLLYNQN